MHELSITRSVVSTRTWWDPITTSAPVGARTRSRTRGSSDVVASVLVAGIGNIFLSDDSFGPEVARGMLAADSDVVARPGVRVVDYGIRGMHLAYDLLDGVDALVLIDALPGKGDPGELLTAKTAVTTTVQGA